MALLGHHVLLFELVRIEVLHSLTFAPFGYTAPWSELVGIEVKQSWTLSLIESQYTLV